MTVWGDYSMLPLQRQLEIPREPNLHADRTAGTPGSELQHSPLPVMLPDTSPGLRWSAERQPSEQLSLASLAALLPPGELRRGKPLALEECEIS